MAEAAYDQIADWYEHEFLGRQTGDPLGIEQSLRDLLGHGSDTWRAVARPR